MAAAGKQFLLLQSTSSALGGVERDHMMIVLDDYRGFTIKNDQTW
jgi:hypothetical protein